jgi:hypothetical protein
LVLIHRLTNVPTSEFESEPGHIEAAVEPFFAWETDEILDPS